MPPPEKMPLKERLRACERRWIIDALATTRGDVRAAAGLLSIPERTLWYRLKVLDIAPEMYRDGGA